MDFDSAFYGFLREHGLEKYHNVLADNGYHRVSDFFHCTDDQIISIAQTLCIPRGDGFKLLNAIRSFSSRTAPMGPPPDSQKFPRNHSFDQGMYQQSQPQPGYQSPPQTSYSSHSGGFQPTYASQSGYPNLGRPYPMDDRPPPTVPTTDVPRASTAPGPIRAAFQNAPTVIPETSGTCIDCRENPRSESYDSFVCPQCYDVNRRRGSESKWCRKCGRDAWRNPHNGNWSSTCGRCYDFKNSLNASQIASTIESFGPEEKVEAGNTVMIFQQRDDKLLISGPREVYRVLKAEIESNIKIQKEKHRDSITSTLKLTGHPLQFTTSNASGLHQWISMCNILDQQGYTAMSGILGHGLLFEKKSISDPRVSSRRGDSDHVLLCVGKSMNNGVFFCGSKRVHGAMKAQSNIRYKIKDEKEVDSTTWYWKMALKGDEWLLIGRTSFVRCVINCLFELKFIHVGEFHPSFKDNYTVILFKYIG